MRTIENYRLVAERYLRMAEFSERAHPAASLRQAGDSAIVPALSLVPSLRSACS
jgi:hypothetical protein